MQSFSQWLDLPELQTARFTSVFRQQFHEWSVERRINFLSVLSEIKALQSVPGLKTNTKRASRFKGGPLDGLMHKHFATARNIVRNLNNHWTPNFKLRRVVSRMHDRPEDKEYSTDLSPKAIHRIIMGGYEDKNRERSITGDWIIYLKHKHTNYYLFLAEHDEDQTLIFSRMALCTRKEYPELEIQMSGSLSKIAPS